MIPSIKAPLSPIFTSETLTIHSLVPPQAQQGWKLELVDVAETIPLHYHKLQRQFIITVEGKLYAHYDTQGPTELAASQFTVVDPADMYI